MVEEGPLRKTWVGGGVMDFALVEPAVLVALMVERSHLGDVAQRVPAELVQPPIDGSPLIAAPSWP
jgi:hypothetical protein